MTIDVGFIGLSYSPISWESININITEDFSDDSVEEFFAAADPNINEYQDDGKADNVLVYSVEFDDYEHAESYKVYRINV